jgi:hypothetical protein
MKNWCSHKKVGEIFQKDHYLSIQAVAELANVDKGTTQQILCEHFNVKKSVLKDGAENPHSWAKGNSNERSSLH